MGAARRVFADFRLAGDAASGFSQGLTLSPSQHQQFNLGIHYRPSYFMCSKTPPSRLRVLQRMPVRHAHKGGNHGLRRRHADHRPAAPVHGWFVFPKADGMPPSIPDWQASAVCDGPAALLARARSLSVIMRPPCAYYTQTACGIPRSNSGHRPGGIVARAACTIGIASLGGQEPQGCIWPGSFCCVCCRHRKPSDKPAEKAGAGSRIHIRLLWGQARALQKLLPLCRGQRWVKRLNVGPGAALPVFRCRSFVTQTTFACGCRHCFQKLNAMFLKF